MSWEDILKDDVIKRKLDELSIILENPKTSAEYKVWHVTGKIKGMIAYMERK
jgi:hypothetical protein